MYNYCYSELSEKWTLTFVQSSYYTLQNTAVIFHHWLYFAHLTVIYCSCFMRCDQMWGQLHADNLDHLLASG